MNKRITSESENVLINVRRNENSGMHKRIGLKKKGIKKKIDKKKRRNS